MENKFGNFVWNNKSAYLPYGTEGNMYYILTLDNPGEPGNVFIDSLKPGDEIVLKDENIKLTVIKMRHEGTRISCDAKAL